MNWTIANDNPLAYNDPDNKGEVAIKQGESIDITQTVSIKPLSIVLYKVRVKQ